MGIHASALFTSSYLETENKLTSVSGVRNLYRQSLMIHLKDRSFLDSLTMLRWFSLEIQSAHLVPLTFILDLLDGMKRAVLRPVLLADKVWGRRLIRACLDRLAGVKGLGLGEATEGLERSLVRLVRVSSESQSDRVA
jgi:hypothetical protein